ncbi:YchJ family metal-binding protein [Vibrio sp.]|nr:YchJ family metal-binding protein [Vibrio sp.]
MTSYDLTACPCGSSKAYTDCCKLVHEHHQHAVSPEMLMRARYAAHVFKLVNFVIQTYHPSCHAQNDAKAIAESVHSDWISLHVLEAMPPKGNEGFVTFTAHFEQNNESYQLTERSRFIKEDGLWYYIDGEFPSDHEPKKEMDKHKIGRNDPCICGSGKKFKKCCA